MTLSLLDGSHLACCAVLWTGGDHAHPPAGSCTPPAECIRQVGMVLPAGADKRPALTHSVHSYEYTSGCLPGPFRRPFLYLLGKIGVTACPHLTKVLGG